MKEQHEYDDKQNKQSKKKNYFLVGILAIFIFAGIIYNAIGSDPSSGSENVGYTAEPVSLGNVSYTLVGSDYNGDLHTFHFVVENIGNDPVNIIADDYYIKNGEKKFKSNSKDSSNTNINPGMTSDVDVTFEMPLEDLTEGEPKIFIDNGLFFENSVEITLK